MTDPPYHLTSIVKRFANSTPEKEVFAANNPTAAYGRLSRGFMGKVWDGGDVAFSPDVWRAVYRVLKPGAHLIAFGGTRTYHRMACAIEDAGFEIRDQIAWLYGSGFPKSHDVSKGIDRSLGAVREVVDRDRGVGRQLREMSGSGSKEDYWTGNIMGGPVTDAAREWDGWGTALKPAIEPIVLARKPLSGTVAANTLEHGTGALNIDGCRIATDDVLHAPQSDPHARGQGAGEYCVSTRDTNAMHAAQRASIEKLTALGRWPANVIHDGSEEVTAGFPDRVSNGDGVPREMKRNTKVHEGWGGINTGPSPPSGLSYNDTGTVARFFYSAKADSDDRLGSKHPTVKPLDLMQYLVRLVTPKGGIVLDLFAGTGTTGEAAWREGMRCVLIEAEAEYQADIRRRMKLCLSGPDERARESIKAKGLPIDHGPLFAALQEET